MIGQVKVTRKNSDIWRYVKPSEEEKAEAVEGLF